MGVFPGYAVRHGQALIDRRLYLPQDWANDADRRAVTWVPDDVGFATKPAIAHRMIARNHDAGVRCAWVHADAAYGCNHSLRRKLEERGQPFILAVRSNHHLGFIDESGIAATTPSGIAEDLDGKDWTTLAAGEGSKGIRLHGWACNAVPWQRRAGWEHCLLVRRCRRDSDGLAHIAWSSARLAPDRRSLPVPRRDSVMIPEISFQFG